MDEDEYGKNSRKTVSKLTEVQKVLELSHIFESTQRILALFSKPEGLYSYFYLTVEMIRKLQPELKPIVGQNF